MKLSMRGVAAAILFAFAATSPAWADQPATSKTAATTPEQKRQAFVEQHLADLHEKLAITDAQASQWSAYADVVRSTSEKGDHAFHDHADKAATATAPEVMDSYANLAALHAENMKKLASAFSDLYNTLSPTQKATADDLFRHPDRVHGHGGPRKGKPAGKHSAPASASSAS